MRMKMMKGVEMKFKIIVLMALLTIMILLLMMHDINTIDANTTTNTQNGTVNIKKISSIRVHLMDGWRLNG
jgi:hypothetical protein